MTAYRAIADVPPLVEGAITLATRMRFERSCSPEVGRLLCVLAGQVRGGRAGELGTGCGVGAAWTASALTAGASLVTVEADAKRATAVRDLFAAVDNVRVVHGDWREALAEGPFALLFADIGEAKSREPGRLVEAMAIGGLVVLDDLTPEDRWPPEWRGKPDPVREFWLNDARLAATEILVTPTSSVVLATRLA